MSAAYVTARPSAPEFFADARAHATHVEQTLTSPTMLHASHETLEALLVREGREWARRLLEAHFALRAAHEARVAVVGADGVVRTAARDTRRHLETQLGRVGVPRRAYQAAGCDDLHPMDAALNLPREVYSFGLQACVAHASARASFDEVVRAVEGSTGGAVPKRQVEHLAVRAAADFDAFYAQRTPRHEPPEELLILSTDAKGVVMRLDDLRPATRKAAMATRPTLRTRLAPGEKADRKRMAQVATVYTVARWPRTAADVVATLRDKDAAARRPTPRDKRVWASVATAPQAVIRAMFDEAQRRDPLHRRRWVVLVDGEPRQLRAVKAAARRVGVRVTIVVDLIHVLEYVWMAARALFGESSPAAEAWVGDRLLALLSGRRGGDVARTMRWWARRPGVVLSAAARAALTKACRYLANRTRTRLLRYAEALRDGLPIATGVVEGACRYLVKDRMDRTGACWSLTGAEAVLRLRALWASGDFEAYWRFHVDCEKTRNHATRYADRIIPDPLPVRTGHLRRVK